MNDLVVWVTDKWVTNTPTNGQGYVVWYYVARYLHVEELHIRLRFYESAAQRERLPAIAKADLEFRVRAGVSGQESYYLFEKQEAGLKPLGTFPRAIDLLIHVDTAKQ